jgi:hypothetical protein
MVREGIGRISKRKDGKYFLYLPKSVVEDTAFPFAVETSVSVRVIMDRLKKRLIVIALARPRR